MNPTQMEILNFKLLSDAQCDKMIHDSASIVSREGLVFGKSHSGEVDPTRYKGREAFLDLQPPLAWLRGVLQSALDRATAQYVVAPLRLLEMPRLLTYETDSHFDWHVDAVPGSFRGSFLCPTRRFTASIQLSRADEYSGGDLQIQNSGRVDVAPRVRGNVVLFPATWMHKVSPITSGHRAALVMWGY